MSLKVLVNSFEKVQGFVNVTNSSLYDIDLIAGHGVYLDAKSIMGILSCNIKEPMTVVVNCNDETENKRLESQLMPYLV